MPLEDGILIIKPKQIGLINMFYGLLVLKDENGVSVLPFILIMSIVLFIGQQFLMMDQQNTFKNILMTQSVESQKALLSNLEDLVADELALRNSRFNINTNFYQCLYATPSPCDETQAYDMILYSPNPPVTYGGGAWPTPPAGISKIAGGLNSNKVVYTRAAGICSQSEPNQGCPIQAIIQFKPLCGGTPSDPTPQATPGACSGRANGFDVYIGVGVYKNGELVYKNDSGITGDTRIYRIKATSLLN